MRVLMVVGGSLQGSGVRTAAKGLRAVLAEAGHTVSRCPIDEQPRRSANRVNAENTFALLRDVVRVVGATLRDRPDLAWFHTLGFPLLPGLRTLAIVLSLRILRVPVVVHLHAYGLDLSAVRSRRLASHVLRFVGLLASEVIVLHEDARAAVSKVVSAQKVDVIGNVVEVPAVPTPIPAGMRLRLVFVGGIVDRKGLPELLEAMRLIASDVELHIVGGVGEDGADRAAAIVESAADLVSAGRVVLHGQLNDAGVREQLRFAHVFVLPSRAEGMPLAMLEAMAVGRPVIVSEAGNMGTVVRASGSGWLVEVTPVSIADAIDAAYADRLELGARGARAHDWVNQAHDRASRAVSSVSERLQQYNA